MRSGDNNQEGGILPKNFLKWLFISDMRLQKPSKLKIKKKQTGKN